MSWKNEYIKRYAWFNLYTYLFKYIKISKYKRKRIVFIINKK